MAKVKYVCGGCNSEINDSDNYCTGCGKELKPLTDASPKIKNFRVARFTIPQFTGVLKKELETLAFTKGAISEYKTAIAEDDRVDFNKKLLKEAETKLKDTTQLINLRIKALQETIKK